MWMELGLGLLGWLLLLAGFGKLTLWPQFRASLAVGILGRPLARVLGWTVPWVEAVTGIALLARPQPWAAAVALPLFWAFAAYQLLALRRGAPSECHCYGRLRPRLRSGPPAILGNVLLGLLAALEVGGSWPLARGPWHPTLRLAGGALLAVVYLVAQGAGGEGPTHFPVAEMRYLLERERGLGDRQVRLLLAQEFGVSPHAVNLMLPRARTAWLLWRRRVGWGGP